MFAFRLCLALGIPHPDYLYPKLTSRQFAEWVAFYKLRPFGEDVLQYMVALLTSEIKNCWRVKGQEAVSPEDYMPGYVKPQQTGDEMNSILNQAIEAACGRR